MLTQRQACEGEGQAVPAATQVIIIEKKNQDCPKFAKYSHTFGKA